MKTRHAGTQARRHAVLAALAVVAGGCAPIQTQAPPPEAPPVTLGPVVTERQVARLADARDASRRGDYQQALSLFRAILAENPAMGAAYVGIGQVHLETQEYAAAETALSRAVRLEPRSFDAQYGHGLALQMLDRLVEAVRAYERALALRPESFDASLHIATSYLQLGRPDAALGFAQRAVQLEPGSGPSHATLGSAYAELGRYGDAAREYEAAIELMEATPPLLMNLIGALAQEQRYLDARNTAEWLVRLAPSAAAWERLGWCAFRMADYDASLDAYRKALEEDPNHWPSLNGFGCNALNKWLLGGKRDAELAREARDAFRRSLQIRRDQPKVIDLLLRYGL